MKKIKIDFKKTKYMLPAIILPFVLILGYLVIDIANTKVEKETNLQQSDEFNASLPEVSEKSTQIKSKMQEMLDNYELSKGSTPVTGVEKETEEKEVIESGYTRDEKEMVDSLEEARKKEQEMLRNMQEQTRQMYDRALSGGAYTDGAGYRQQQGTARQEQAAAQLTDNPQMDQLTRQMQLIQRMADGERILTPEEEQKQKERQIAEEARQRTLDSIAAIQAPLAVSKTTDAAERHFNTVSQDKETSDLIKGRIDELVKVKDGSRLRIRLSEDVEIDGVRVKAGTCLYANVTGFSAQRVKAQVTSVLLGGKIRKVDLSIYDLDGQEGLFVPSSSFRDLAKEAGSNAMNMNMNINSSGQNLEGMAMQTLQQTLQSVTGAVSSEIKKNRAKLKFNTEIYLVDANNK